MLWIVFAHQANLLLQLLIPRLKIMDMAVRSMILMMDPHPVLLKLLTLTLWSLALARRRSPPKDVGNWSSTIIPSIAVGARLSNCNWKGLLPSNNPPLMRVMDRCWQLNPYSMHTGHLARLQGCWDGPPCRQTQYQGK